jgi:hypothetical protein
MMIFLYYTKPYMSIKFCELSINTSSLRGHNSSSHDNSIPLLESTVMESPLISGAFYIVT